MRKELPTNANPFHQNGQPTATTPCRGLLAFVAQGSNLRAIFRTTLRTTTQPALKAVRYRICSKLLHFLPFFFFGRKFIAGRGWEFLKDFIKYIKNFSKIFKKFWELDRKIFSPVRVPSVVWRFLAWKTRVKRLLHFFSHLHNYETFRHIYTRQSSDQFDFFELAQGLHKKPFIGKTAFRRTALAFPLTIQAQIVLCKGKLASHLI